MELKDYLIAKDEIYKEEVSSCGFKVKMYKENIWCVMYHDMFLTKDNNWRLNTGLDSIFLSGKEECISKLLEFTREYEV